MPGGEDRLEELRGLVREHDRRYYRDASPIISDREYDLIKREMEDLEAELDPLGLFKSEDSPDPIGRSRPRRGRRQAGGVCFPSSSRPHAQLGQHL